MVGMNALPLILAATNDTPLMLKVVYWLLVILWAVGAISTATSATPNPAVVRGTNGVLIVLFAILGYVSFGF